MDWFVRAFMKASLTSLGLGVSLGLAIAAHPAWIIYRPAHVHLNLLGFVSMMIYGVAYHVIPRFTGHPLHSRAIAGAQWWIAVAGLAGMVAGFLSLPHQAEAGRAILVLGGVLSAAGAYLFIYNIWRTIGGADVPAPPRPTAARPLPVR